MKNKGSERVEGQQRRNAGAPALNTPARSGAKPLLAVGLEKAENIDGDGQTYSFPTTVLPHRPNRGLSSRKITHTNASPAMIPDLPRCSW